MAKSTHGNVGNINACVHKAYVKKLLDKNEQKLFSVLYEELYKEYALEGRPADQLLLSIVTMDTVRLFRAYVAEIQNGADVSDVVSRISSEIRKNLNEMGVTGKTKVVETSTASLTSIFTMLSGKSP